MKILIAIPACWRYTGTSVGSHVTQPGEQIQAYREHLRAQLIWIPDPDMHEVWRYPEVEYKFFYGRPNETPCRTNLEGDAIILDAPDDYLGLPEKCKQLFKWALDQGFNYVFKCDDDTGIVVSRLLKSGFEQFDYSGFPNPWGGMTYASGGAGYWLNRKTMEIVVNGERDKNDPVGWAEDWTTGRLLRETGIPLHGDTRYLPIVQELTEFVVLSRAGFISFHGCKPKDLRLIQELVVTSKAA